MTRKEIETLSTVIRGLVLTGELSKVGATILANQLGEKIPNFNPSKFEHAAIPKLETK
jgi:hypothetical protein